MFRLRVWRIHTYGRGADMDQLYKERLLMAILRERDIPYLEAEVLVNQFHRGDFSWADVPGVFVEFHERLAHPAPGDA